VFVLGTPNHFEHGGLAFRLMWVLHSQIVLSLNYLQPRLSDFHRSMCANIASYKAIIRTQYPHPTVNYTNGKNKFKTLNYALNLKTIQMKKD
jgi:hypothetical protein